MSKTLRSLALVIATALAVVGCVPMAMFASGGGTGYSGLRQDWGTFVSSTNVNALCISPKLRFVIWEFEGKFGKRIVMNSGYRNAFHNAAAGGADNSYHTKCMAADFYIPGVPKDQLIAFARTVSGVGGLGCYPGRNFIHIDIRDRPRGYRGPVTFSGC